MSIKMVIDNSNKMAGAEEEKERHLRTLNDMRNEFQRLYDEIICDNIRIRHWRASEKTMTAARYKQQMEALDYAIKKSEK